MTEELTVGKLVNTHGIRGEIKVLSHTDFPDVRFASGKKLIVVPGDGTPKFEVTVESAREHKGMYIVRLKGYTNINEVEKYKGSLLKVPSDDLVELPENEYYFHHIVGCEVYTDEEDSKPLGTVTEILQPGANDVWVVKPAKGPDILIPVIPDVVLDVNVEAKTNYCSYHGRATAMIRIDVLTLFPEMCEGVFGTSILGKAREKGIVSLNAVNFRDFSGNKHNSVDDTPYGGGGGMVLKPDPIFNAVEHVLEQQDSNEGVPTTKPRIILMCPQGKPYNQKIAEELAQEQHLIFICGHYEGYDERIREHLVTDELSIGDYVLTGGELPALTVIDSVVRLQRGALGNETSAISDSFSTGLLEYPHYTRPAEFRGWKVPDILLSGHHANIEIWRREQALQRTLERRPDLLETADLTLKDKKTLARLKNGGQA